MAQRHHSDEGIATNILADRLSKPLDTSLAEQFPSDLIPSRDAYRPTSKGKSLLPILKSIADWGVTNLPGTAKLMKAK